MLAANAEPAIDRRAAESLNAPQPIDPSAAIVNAARLGDRAAFAMLHARFAPLVHGIALARMPRAEASDLVQETFTLALDRLHTLRVDAAFGPWLATIARNLTVEFHRRARLRTHESMDVVASSQASPNQTDETEQAMHLLNVIQSLPESYAETLTLRLVEGLSGPQIAACTGMTHGSVRVNLTRGMQLLRERLAECGMSVEDTR